MWTMANAPERPIRLNATAQVETQCRKGLAVRVDGGGLRVLTREASLRGTPLGGWSVAICSHHHRSHGDRVCYYGDGDNCRRHSGCHLMHCGARAERRTPDGLHERITCCDM